jgi:DNA-binding NtrC family response regulator
LLATHFVNLSVKELRCPMPRLTRAAIASLQDYDWPGNVRELHNVVERAVILARGGILRFSLPVPAATAKPSQVARLETGPGYLRESEMRGRERDNLIAVLNKAGWKIKGPDGAAEMLGIKPTTLLSRIKAMAIERPQSQ